MASKNITIRLSYEDLEFFNNLAAEHKIDRTALIRRAVKSYTGATRELSILEQAKEVSKSAGITENVVRIADISHPLLDVIRREGITVKNNEGSKITKIKSIVGLLDFVQKNVFNFKTT